MAAFSLIFSQPRVPLSRSIYFRKVALFCLPYPLPWRPLPPSDQLEKKGERGEEGCTLFGQTDNPNRIWRSTARGCVGLAEAQLAHKHTHARTHALVLHTQLWECSRWRAKSPFLLHIYSLLPLVLPPFCRPGPPSCRPLALLHPSFLLW